MAATKTLYKQCILRSGDSIMTAWLEADKVKEGTRVTLKDSQDPEEWWTIESVGEFALSKDDFKGEHDAKNWYKKDFHGTLRGIITK